MAAPKNGPQRNGAPRPAKWTAARGKSLLSSGFDIVTSCVPLGDVCAPPTSINRHIVDLISFQDIMIISVAQRMVSRDVDASLTCVNWKCYFLLYIPILFDWKLVVHVQPQPGSSRAFCRPSPKSGSVPIVRWRHRR